ncbi:MAG: archaemetzincin family Zn-dependent metalloprotease [Thermoanaerobaculia bacterium]
MRPIRIVPLAGAQPRLVSSVSRALAREFRTKATAADPHVDVAFAYHPERNQYHSTMIVEHLARVARTKGSEITIGVADVDLFIPILTFVFGEAELGGNIAVVSYHRLHQEYYGLARDEQVLEERLVKEAVHEVGHTAGLTHCDDYECVMAPSHAVEWLDLKGGALCDACRHRAGI